MFFYGSWETPADRSGGFFKDWHIDAFRECTAKFGKVLTVIDFAVHGKNYAERKEDVRNKALDYQNLCTEGVRLTWEEVAAFEEYFTKQGKRYGLLTEFRENAIC